MVKWIVLPYMIGWLLSEYLPKDVTQTAVDLLLPNTLFTSVNASSTSVEKDEVDVNVIVKEEAEEEADSSDDDDGNSEDESPEETIRRALGGSDVCFQRLLQSIDEQDARVANHLMQMVGDDNGGVHLILHRNGDIEGCGMSLDFLSALRMTLMTLPECPVAFSKYDVESILTSAFHQATQFCDSEEADRMPEEGFLGYCDMGIDKTPILLDHDSLVPVALSVDSAPEDSYLPCHFHTREGVRMTSFQKLVSLIVDEYKTAPVTNCDDENDPETCEEEVGNEVHLYAVPAGRTFMFAPAFVGETFDLPHILGADPDLPVYMKVLSLSPRVFDIFNYFTRDESDGIVEKAKAEKSDSHKIKRSSTGASGYNINTRRTSESGFDTHGKTAQAVKRRCFQVLGFDEYIESHSDGLQILRYNQTKAYTAHMDWIDDDGKQDHNYDSAGKGGNRFATILLYMTDLKPEDGGETVFIKGKPLGDNPTPYKQALKELRLSKHAKLFKRDSWEEKMVATCRSSLAVNPNSARAVLFYSQLPNGEPDPASLHGGCPVVTDEPKWAANLWVWNTPRAGFDGAPMNEKRMAEKKANGETPTPSGPAKKHVTFTNEEGNPDFAKAEMYYEDSFWARLGGDDPPQAVNSYEGQVWNIKAGGKIVKTWTVGKEPTQKYSF